MKNKYKYKKVVKVNCKKCRRWVDEDLTTFVNIEEDFQGADVLTYICPYCRTEQKSKRFA
jgi:RNA polymerase subunit RPABC4/transcription elongation factor Spt4